MNKPASPIDPQKDDPMVNHIPAITGTISPHPDPLFRFPKILSPYKTAIISFASSTVSTTLGFPLDSLKTRMQTYHFTNSFDCLRSTIYQEGVKGLFRGLSAPLISASCARSFGVSMYTHAKPCITLIGHSIWGDSPIVKRRPLSDIVDSKQQNFDKVLNNIPVALITGWISGCMVSCFACPFELTKISSQILILADHSNHKNINTTTTNNKLPNTILQVGRMIAKYQGYSGLYSGFRYHLLRDSLSSGLFYGSYETVKLIIKSKGEHFFDDNDWRKKSIDLASIPLAGAFAGTFACVAVYPIDTIKSQYQRDVVGNILKSMELNKDNSGLLRKKSISVEHPSLVSILKRLPTREIYKGMGPSAIRSMTTTVVFFSIFEYSMSNIS